MLAVLFRYLADRKLRKRIHLEKSPLDRFQVRLARTLEEYEQAFRLVQFAYVVEGIESVRSSRIRFTPQHLFPEAHVLVAFDGDCAVGTMTVTVDSPAGLPLDKDYSQELKAVRQPGRVLVEYGSLAVVERCKHLGVTNLLNMAAYQLAITRLHASHVVIGVNPRVKSFYRATYDFAQFGPVRQHASLYAPVVGLVQDLSRFHAFMCRHYRKPMLNGRMPVDYFFGTAPEALAFIGEQNPDVSAQAKMPRGVFQALAQQRPDLLTDLGPEARTHLQEVRSRSTVDLSHEPTVSPPSEESSPPNDVTASHSGGRPPGK